VISPITSGRGSHRVDRHFVSARAQQGVDIIDVHPPAHRQWDEDRLGGPPHHLESGLAAFGRR
jgi:hypothetical protein